MGSTLNVLRFARTASFSAALWLFAAQPASAQTLLAQTGGGKTAVGWVIVLLCIGLGLLVVCRPSVRQAPVKRKGKATK
jgi:hypothetical protein